MVGRPILEPGDAFQKGQLDSINRAIAVFGDFELGPVLERVAGKASPNCFDCDNRSRVVADLQKSAGIRAAKSENNGVLCRLAL